MNFALSCDETDLKLHAGMSYHFDSFWLFPSPPCSRHNPREKPEKRTAKNELAA